jgi:ABC-2 type transport system permease protein/oleandomycin transport system permease protein
MRRLVTDTLIIAERNLVRLPRAPDLLLAFTVQPIMFVLLFRYVFGGAIRTPGFSYVDYLIPGIIVQNIAFGGFVTAIGLNEDVHKGLIDRFRSLPMARSAVLAGRTLSDIVTNALSMAVLIITGLIIGFSFHTSVLHAIAGAGLLLLFGYAFSWFFALVGLIARSTEAANSVGSSPSSRSPSSPPRSSRCRRCRRRCAHSPRSTRSRSSSTRCARCGSAPRPATTSGRPSSGRW